MSDLWFDPAWVPFHLKSGTSHWTKDQLFGLHLRKNGTSIACRGHARTNDTVLLDSQYSYKHSMLPPRGYHEASAIFLANEHDGFEGDFR